jgi:hypothetical protein
MSEFTKIYVPLSRDEFMALRESAQHELRDPRDQARYMLRSMLLQTNNQADSKSTTQTTLPTGTTPAHI